MGKPRKEIVFNHRLSHVIFRTHNKSFYFHTNQMKDKVLDIIQHYLTRPTCEVKIFEWVIMSNHLHFLIYYPDVSALSNFMRDINAAIARLINERFKKSGQAISDRFKSPVIADGEYCNNVIEYIWLNPVNAKMYSLQSISSYKYGSLYYRYHGKLDPIAESYQTLNELEKHDILRGRTEQEFVKERLEELKKLELINHAEEVYEHSHSIGPLEYVKERIAYFRHQISSQLSKLDPPNGLSYLAANTC